MLDKQIQVFEIDTGNFYSNEEARLHLKNHKLRSERNQLINGGFINNKTTKEKRKIIGLKDIEKNFAKYNITEENLNDFRNGTFGFLDNVDDKDIVTEYINSYFRLKDLIAMKNKVIKKSKDDLLRLLENKVNERNNLKRSRCGAVG